MSLLLPILEGDVSAEVRRRWVRRVKNAQRQLGRLEANAIKDVLGTLRRARTNILDAVVSTGSEFQQWFLPQVKGAADAAIRAYAEELQRKIAGHVEAAAQLGVDRVGAAANALDVTLPRVPIGIPPKALELAQQIVPEFIQAERDEMIRAVGREIRMAFAGGQNRAQLTARVKALVTKRLRFEDKQTRAEVIVRTEINRIHNAAHQETMAELGAENVRIRKEWISSGDDRTRPAHRALNGVVVDVDKPFPYPGLPRSRWPMYPLDPILPAEDSINCRCATVEIFDIIDEDTAAAVAEEVNA